MSTPFTFTENGRAVLQGVARAANSRAAAQAAGIGVRRVVRTWLRDLDQYRPSKHASDLPGSPSTHYYAQAVESVTAPDVAGNRVTVSVTQVGFRQRLLGGDIVPVNGGKYLTIPGTAIAYGTRALYTSLAQLHYQGALTLMESECSDPLPPGCAFGATGTNNPGHATMQALVLSVDEDIDTGTTTVQFGPPAFLSLEEMEQLFRANLGLLPSWKLAQRTTGVTATGSNVIGDRHFADTHVVNPPPVPTPPSPFPFQVTWRTNPADSSGNTFQAKVQLNSSLYPSSSQGASGGNNLAITGLDTWFDLDANDTIWLLCAVDPTTLTVTPGTPTMHSFGMGNTDYAPSAAATAAGGIAEINTSDSPSQIWIRKVIADSIADANGKPTVRQYVQTDMVIYNCSFNGVPVIYPYPL